MCLRSGRDFGTVAACNIPSFASFEAPAALSSIAERAKWSTILWQTTM